MSGTTDKMAGKAKKTIGKMTDNKKMQAEGKTQETKGKMKSGMKDAGETLSRKTDDTSRKHVL
ncbi:CsbD family protein [Candidatus Saccharibacteria bacterium]|nr:CsbD family protein [Candidatus Saccharibacteria bacterium]